MQMRFLFTLEKHGRIHGRSRVSCFGEQKAVYTERKANWLPTDGRTHRPTQRPIESRSTRLKNQKEKNGVRRRKAREEKKKEERNKSK